MGHIKNMKKKPKSENFSCINIIFKQIDNISNNYLLLIVFLKENLYYILWNLIFNRNLYLLFWFFSICNQYMPIKYLKNGIKFLSIKQFYMWI